MADPFVAEIRIFPFNFAPKGWAFCDGQILPLSQNTALFSLLGTTYGGDGKSTFALPNLQGNAPLHQGQGPGLQLWDLGEIQGSDTVSLLESEIPAHAHALQAQTQNATNNSPAGGLLAAGHYGGAQGGAVNYYATTSNPATLLSPTAIAPAGGDQPHNNLMPYLTLNFCIALQGVFPPRT
ncbi:MAG TPA: tail fiber protein [Xanthobacteraceae bacterium]|nr:tail fiber protein [Xanthobacteraceae bacterium]